MPVVATVLINGQPSVRRRRTFLDLPIEIRSLIYRLSLTAPSSIIPPLGKVKALRTASCTCLRRSAGILSTTIPHHLPHRVLEETQYDHWHPSGLTIGLLCVNKQIHLEAASVLYGNNEFVFRVGVQRHNWHVVTTLGCRQEYYDFADNVLGLAPYYLQMIRKCHLRVRLLTTPFNVARPAYLNAKEVITLLADVFHNRDHCLQKLTITLSAYQSDWGRPRHDVSFFENVLEPLGTICCIREVEIQGVTPEFEVKMTNATMGPEMACSPARAKYGTKIVKRKGRKRIRHCKLGKYYDSNYDWTEDVLATSHDRAIDIPEPN